ncbi:MAG: hypothetical protein K9M80_04720 [Candidatus Marinimicrobia bacterium]|nr:hypothetical protein [Candidatus Neomarinimicrobiota bacterium]
MKRENLFMFVILLIIFILSGCSRVTDAIVDGAVGGLSKAASERAANAVYERLAPKEKLPAPATAGWNQFMITQAQVVFTYAFAPGGLWISKDSFTPGEYAKFKMDNEENSHIVIEKAFLKKLDNGNEWWRISWKDEQDIWIYEALLSPEEGRVLRLRAKDAKGNQGEVPVTNQSVYMQPTQVTEESIEGAKIGEETITTPAGTFNTDHIRYIATTSSGSTDWWLTPKVPGGVVKYQMRDENKDVVWTSTMIEKGTTATSQLESY